MGRVVYLNPTCKLQHIWNKPRSTPEEEAEFHKAIDDAIDHEAEEYIKRLRKEENKPKENI